MRNLLIILFLFTALSGCDYEPIFSTKNSGFSINNIKESDQSNITREIAKSLKIYKNYKEKKIYDVTISTNKTKIITSKDSRGNTKSFRLTVICDFVIFENNKEIKSKNYIENFEFNNDSDKFKLRKYEASIEGDLVTKIIKDIILELYSL